MKTTKKFFSVIFILLIANNPLFAQYPTWTVPEPKNLEWKEPPKATERVLGVVERTIPGGYILCYLTDVDGHKAGDKIEGPSISIETGNISWWIDSEAGKLYEDTYPNYTLRDYRCKEVSREERHYRENKLEAITYWIDYKLTATVVVPENHELTKTDDEDVLSKALHKALQDIREGSRIALDQVKVLSGMDKNEYKDQIVEILLDKGYKVAAKEYLEKLYDEQQAQQSGKYNEKTKVKENNLSAVGYYLNVRLTETSLRVQIINVSTGEYDANVTIKLQQ